MSEDNERFVLICNRCGSQDIRSDAIICVNNYNRTGVLDEADVGWLDNTWCEDCAENGDDHYDFREEPVEDK